MSRRWAVALGLLVLLVAVGCEEDPDPETPAEAEVFVSAQPATLDRSLTGQSPCPPEDDPDVQDNVKGATVSNKVCSEVTATVLVNGMGEEDLEVRFSTNAGDMLSGGTPRRTNSRGDVTDVLAVIPDEIPDAGVVVTARSGSVSASADPIVLADTGADLDLTMVVNDAAPLEGEEITYTLTLTNLGPDDATAVFVSAPVPAGLAFVSSSATAGAYDAVEGEWAIDALNAGRAETLTLRVSVDQGQVDATITNTASASAAQTDPSATNNVASVDITVGATEADLSISKTVNDSSPVRGDEVIFNITITNNGPEDATGVTVTDPNVSTSENASLVFISAAPSSEYDAASGLWTVGGTGSLARGRTESLQLTAQVNADDTTLTNTVTIDRAAGLVDPDPSNDTASVDLTVGRAESDLSVQKDVDEDFPLKGEAVRFTVTVSNNGPDDASSVVVTDVFPGRLSVISTTPSQGTYDLVSWDVGELPVGPAATLIIEATVPSDAIIGETFDNTARRSSADQTDPNDANNEATVTLTVGTVDADLEVTKVSNDPTPEVGDTVAFTVTVTNLGLETANDVVVTDNVPFGLTLNESEITTTRGTYDPATGEWTVGQLTLNQSATMTLVTSVDSGQEGTSITNTARARAIENDPNPTNDSASATVDVEDLRADLVVDKEVEPTVPREGDLVTYTVVVSNSGPDPATEVIVTDPVPAGLTFDSATTSVSTPGVVPGSYDENTGRWAVVGGLEPGAFATLVLRATVNAGESGSLITNTASADAEEDDPDTSSNTATVQFTVQSAQ